MALRILACGDPWPSANWPKKALAEAVSFAMAGQGRCGRRYLFRVPAVPLSRNGLLTLEDAEVKPLRAALYARVSTVDQTCAQQLTALREYAERAGWKVEEFVDHAQSGAKDDRPALVRLMELARRRKLDVVAVTKMDRFGRSVQQLTHNIKDLDHYGISFLAIDQSIDTGKDSATSRLLLNMLASIAEFERELISERTRAGLARVKAAGVRLGRKPREVDTERARALLAGGLSYRKTARCLGIAVSLLHRSVNQKVS